MPVSTEFTGTRYLYHVVVTGECGPLTQRMFGDVTVEVSRGYTTIVLPARDVSDLNGLLDVIQDLGLHLISLRRSAAAQPHPDPDKPRVGVAGQVPLQSGPDD